VIGPRRWPLHPAPVEGEVLSSWLGRVAACYGTDLEGLGADIGLRIDRNTRDDIDLDPPSDLVDTLAERSGLTLDRLRLMTVAGNVPWLLDDMDPHPDAFGTYARQLSVLRPAGRHKPRQVPQWRPWLPPRLRTRACPGCVANSPSPTPHLLLWGIPIVSSCPEHGCWLEEPIFTRGYVYLAASDLPQPRPAPEHVLALDGRTHDAFTTGEVSLPGRTIHCGVWFRLLRTLIDELSAPLSESRAATARTVKRVWSEAGYRTRDGQTKWYPFEHQNPSLQLHTMEAAAIAVTLLESGTINGPGTEAALFRPAPSMTIFDGTPPPPAPLASSIMRGKPTLMDSFNAAIASAQTNPEEARTLFAVAT